MSRVRPNETRRVAAAVRLAALAAGAALVATIAAAQQTGSLRGLISDDSSPLISAQ